MRGHEGCDAFQLVQCLTLLVLYSEHSTTRPSALQPQANGVSSAKTQGRKAN
jgi:hypothetical protein